MATILRLFPLRMWLLAVGMTVPFAVGKLFGAKSTHLVRDAAAITHHPVHYGLISNLGVVLWCAGAAVCLFASRLLTQRAGGEEPARFLLWTGVLNAVLMIDDFFMIHDGFGPLYLGLPEVAVYAAYGLFGLTYLWRFRRFLLERTPYPMLVLAWALFAASVSMDLDLIPGGIDVEDLLKYYGIGVYTFFCVSTAWGLLRASPDAGPDDRRR